jgi:hypothetical protein
MIEQRAHDAMEFRIQRDCNGEINQRRYIPADIIPYARQLNLVSRFIGGD